MRNMNLSRAVLVILMAAAIGTASAKDEWWGDDDYWAGKGSVSAARPVDAGSRGAAACDSRYPLVDCFNP